MYSTRTFRVWINGTAENRWARVGMRVSPHPAPALAERGMWRAAGIVASLDSEPIRDIWDLARRLRGLNAEFTTLCLRRYRPGRVVVFDCVLPW